MCQLDVMRRQFSTINDFLLVFFNDSGKKNPEVRLELGEKKEGVEFIFVLRTFFESVLYVILKACSCPAWPAAPECSCQASPVKELLHIPNLRDVPPIRHLEDQPLFVLVRKGYIGTRREKKL